MQLRAFNHNADYVMLANWWENHGHPIIDQAALSPIGVVAEKNGVPVAVSFLSLIYGCNQAILSWTTTNPKASLREKHQGVNDCIKSLCSVAKDKEYVNVICFSASKGLTKIIQRHGFNVGKSHDLLAGQLKGIK